MRIQQFAAFVFLFTLVLTGCGSGAEKSGLKIRKGYTSKRVIQVFQQRTRIQPSQEVKPFPVMIEGRDLTFPTLDAAIEAATDGDTIVLGEGVYRGSAVFRLKTVNLKGQGRDKTHVIAKETALFVQESIVHVSGVAFWSTTVGPDVSVAAVKKSTLHLEGCRLSGGTGPGLLVAGTLSIVDLLDNHFVGNMGGGIRIQGGAILSRRNLYYRNAVAGVVLAPAREKAIARMKFWHDTILDNWSGRRCLSFLRSGVVRMEQQGPWSIEATVLNTAGIGQAFSESKFSRIKTDGRNFLSTRALPAKGFFTAAEQGDFRPAGALVKDSLGIELGAYPSKDGSRELVGQMRSALATDKLQLAYNYALFLPMEERHINHRKIQERVYTWLNEFLQDNRVGTRLMGVLVLKRVAPESWKLDVILTRLLMGFKGRYSYHMKHLNFFQNNVSMADEIKTLMVQSQDIFPRFIVTDPDEEKAFILSGRIVEDPVVDSAVRSFKMKQSIKNPRYAKIRETRQLLESRRKKKQQRVRDIEFTLNNPHVHMKKGSRYHKGLVKKFERQKKQLEELEEQIQVLDEEFKKSSEVFDIIVEGELRTTTVQGQFSSQLVAAPRGDILLDTEEAISYTHTAMTVKPIPEFNYEGTTEAAKVPDPMRLMGRAVANRILAAVIQKEAKALQDLMAKYGQGIITSAEEDRLVELLLLNSRLFQKAGDAKAEYERLLKNPGSDKPQVVLSHDERKGLGREGVKVEVVYSSPQMITARRDELKRLYEPYWTMLPDVRKYLQIRFGLTKEMFFKNRELIED